MNTIAAPSCAAGHVGIPQRADPWRFAALFVGTLLAAGCNAASSAPAQAAEDPSITRALQYIDNRMDRGADGLYLIGPDSHYYPSLWLNFPEGGRDGRPWLTIDPCYDPVTHELCLRVSWQIGPGKDGVSWGGVNFHDNDHFEMKGNAVDHGPGYDLATADQLIGWVRSDSPGAAIYPFAGGAGDLGGELTLGWQPAAATWTRFQIPLQGRGANPQKAGFGFLFDYNHPYPPPRMPRVLTFYLRDIHITFKPSRTVPLHLIRSFDSHPTLDTFNRLMGTACQTYDNAAVGLSLIHHGQPEDLRRATLLADAFCYCQSMDPAKDGRLRTSYRIGDIPEHPGGVDPARLPGWWDPLSGPEDFLLTGYDLLQPQQFAARLKAATDPVSTLLRQQLTPPAAQLLRDYNPGCDPTDPLLKGLLTAANQALRLPDFCAKAEIQPDPLWPQDLLQQNRQALEQAYPGILASRKAGYIQSSDSVSTHVGDLSWAILFWLTAHKHLSDPDGKYLHAAEWAGDWIEKNALSNKDQGGYTGGLDGWYDPKRTTPGHPGGQNPCPYKGTEMAEDATAAFGRLYLETHDRRWLQDAIHGRDFVRSMFWQEPQGPGRFLAGTSTDLCDHETDHKNVDQQPMDTNAWAVLVLGNTSQTEAGMDWVLTNCAVEDEAMQGFSFSRFDPLAPDDRRCGVWPEGTGQAICALLALGGKYAPLANRYLAGLNAEQTDGGLVAASHDGLWTGFSWDYNRVEHLAPTVWWLMARSPGGYNPFWDCPLATPPPNLDVLLEQDKQQRQ